MNIRYLQQEEAQLTEPIATLKNELAEISGEAYRGYWLDTTQDRTGKKNYTRLRWFIDAATKRKGCRTLKGDEVGKATRSIELWAEMATLEAKQATVGVMLWDCRGDRPRLGYSLTHNSHTTRISPPQKSQNAKNLAHNSHITRK